MDFFGSFLTQVEIRSAFTPPVIVKGSDLSGPSTGTPSAMITLLKPTAVVTLAGNGTPMVVAPGGEAGPDDWQGGAAALLAFALAYTYMVYKAGQKSRLVSKRN